MKERSQLVLLMSIFLIIGAAQVYFYVFFADFNFSRSELTINGNEVNEKLTFNADKNYHTLYRNFKTYVYHNNSFLLREDISNMWDKIVVSNIGCSHGIPYVKDRWGYFYSPEDVGDSLYTKSNEYGCTFGNIYGFDKGKEYFVEADYRLKPLKLFNIGGQAYIKFVAYSKNRHILLIRGKNLVINDEAVVSRKFFFPNTEVILYIPFTPPGGYTNAVQEDDKYDMIFQEDFDLGADYGYILFMAAILPILFAFLIWRFFGKENIEGDFPEELSQYPKERKAWEVAAYFHPPFGELDENYMPTMVLDFYNRKIIDLKEEKGKPLIKMLKRNGFDAKLDDVEERFLYFLKKAGFIAGKEGDYFSIRKASMKFLKGAELKTVLILMQKQLKRKSKEYVDYKGVWILTASILLLLPITFFGVHQVFIFIYLVVIGIFAKKTSLFTKHKKNYYLEFQQWQGFRRYLKTLDSMKRSPPQGVILWEKYLVYATALGVGKAVAKKLKDWKIIDDNRYHAFAAVHSTGAFGSVGGAGSGGGGGGGGIGGGGGGGR